jgi:hypothetical protein
MQTLLLLAPLVAQFVAFGSRCDIFHPCSSLIIRACRIGIIVNLLWRYQTSREIFLPKVVVVNILQFVSFPQDMHIGKSRSASKLRDGDNMMKSLILMLGDYSETIYEAGVDCTPYPRGDISQVKIFENRGEYGSNSEFIPAREKKESTKINYTSPHEDIRRKRKCSQQPAQTSEVYESKDDILSSMKPRIASNVPVHGGHRSLPKLNLLKYDDYKENFYCKGHLKEKDHSERP